MDNPSQFVAPWGWKYSYHPTLAHTRRQLEVPWGLELFGATICRVTQSGDRSCASGVAQSWEVHKLPKAVAQAELRNPASCAHGGAQSEELRKQSFAILAAQSDKELRNRSWAIQRSFGIGLYSFWAQSLQEVSTRCLCVRSPEEAVSWQDLCTRSLQEVSWQDSWRDLSVRDLHRRSLRGVSK